MELIETAKRPNLPKHSAVIGVENRMSLLERKVYNTLLYFARPHLLEQEHHVIRTATLERALDRDSKNRSRLLTAAKNLQDLSVTYDLFSRDNAHEHLWQQSSSLLSEIAISGDRTILRYAYPGGMARILADPNRYGTIPLEIQTTIEGTYTLPLWELYLDILGGRRANAEFQFAIDDMRRLLCLTDRYPQYKDLRRRVIEPAHSEINDKTNVSVDLIDVIKNGRDVTHLMLRVRRTQAAQGREESVPALVVDETQALDATEDPGLLARLFKLFNEANVQKITARYDAHRIRRNLDYVDRYRGVVRDRAALAQKALQEDYASGTAGLQQKSGAQEEGTKVPASAAPAQPTTRPDRLEAGRAKYNAMSTSEQQRWEQAAAKAAGPVLEHMRSGDPKQYAQQWEVLLYGYIADHSR